jgi:8-oxo-dGTP pyrophosphatase MutT (NUDIX family)
VTGATHPIWDGTDWVRVPVASLEGESMVVAAAAAIVLEEPDMGRILLQRRDRPGEAVRGRLEIPTGRWRPGEDPAAVLAREVAEETGLSVAPGFEPPRRMEAVRGRPYLVLEPVAVALGVEGAYPTLVLAFPCRGSGEPRPEPGWTTEPGWYDLAEVERLLDDPARFTGPSYAVLSTWMGR